MTDDCKQTVFSGQGSCLCELTVTMTTCTSSELAQAGPNPSVESGGGNPSLFLEEELWAMDSCWRKATHPKMYVQHKLDLVDEKKKKEDTNQ